MVGLNPSYTYTKDGVYYFGRKVPKDIQQHYIKNRIVMSLRTKSKYKASIAASNAMAIGLMAVLSVLYVGLSAACHSWFTILLLLAQGLR